VIDYFLEFTLYCVLILVIAAGLLLTLSFTAGPRVEPREDKVDGEDGTIISE